MDTINIEGKSYKFVTNYRSNHELRDRLNALALKVFCFSFEKWYSSGYWTDKYRPYSLMYNDKIVSNVSVNLMEFMVLNQKRKFIQIGTVMTDPKHRNQGLSKILIEKVLEEWKDNCDLIYLFANDSVLDFYPKFGFKPIKEYECSKLIKSKKDVYGVLKLDMSTKANQHFIYEKIIESVSFSKISMLNNPSLIMFNYSCFMNDDVYYIKALETIAIAEYNDNVFFLKDIFCEDDISIDEVIEALGTNKINKVTLGFTPKNTTSYEEAVFKSEDTLFILDDKHEIFKNMKVKFPILSHA